LFQDEEDDKVETDERKRGYNSMYEVKAPTEEEIEMYYKKRKQFDDPMSEYI
jgi:pre-mRNA-processing factor SLU7